MIKIKTKSEIELMKKSGEIVATVLALLEEAARPGVTTLELDKIAENYIKKCGALPSFKGYKVYPNEPGYPGSICASINNEVVHGIPSKRVLKDGDIISIDVGVYLNGFHGDAARTYAVGTVSPEVEKLLAVTKQSFFEGIKKAVSGNRIVDISSAVQTCVESNGFSVVKDFVGHGIGREMHEPPQIPNYRTIQRGPRLEPGMTLAIEPMVNQGSYKVKVLNDKWTVVTEDGSLSAHYENTIAITDAEPLILTII